MLTRNEVIAGWHAFLGRSPDEALIGHGMAVEDAATFIGALASSDEFRARVERGYTDVLTAVRQFEGSAIPTVEPADFLVPTDLGVTPTQVSRVLLIGDCLFSDWTRVITASNPDAAVDHVLFNNGAAFAGQLTRAPADYDCQLLQIPIRLVLPDHELFERHYDQVDRYEETLARCTERLESYVDTALVHTAGAPLFVTNYPVPQQSALGRLMPRYDIRNPTHLFERLNAVLAARVEAAPNVFLLDIDMLASSIGRRLMQDDPFWLTNHGGLMSDYDIHQDGGRLEPTLAHSARFPLAIEGFIGAAWAQVVAMLRTLGGVDSVKMICVDLDDTLWRGVAAERDGVDAQMVEGWPIGFAEALMMCRRRGIILAIVSKNDPERIAPLWPQIFGGTLTLDDFAIRKIGWRPKAEAIREAIADANVLPESVLFIDDNPVERAAVEDGVPGIRALRAPPLDWRRILLWSAETQTSRITAESSRRGEMIQAQVVRETIRKSRSHDDFLAELNVRATLSTIDSVDAAKFARALELLNKTNQFNTTGARWSHADAVAFFADGGVWHVFQAADRFTTYGLVGVVAARRDVLEQFVMSCRVFGMGIETAVLARLSARADGRRLVARSLDTERNMPSRRVYADAGWVRDGDVWVASSSAAETASTVTLSEDVAPEPTVVAAM